MYFYDPAERETKELGPGVVARTFWGDRMLVSVGEFVPGAEAAQHSHPHEQVGTVLDGEVTLVIGEESRTLKAGELFIVPGGVKHSATAGSSGAKVMDIFSPVREEFKY